MGEVTQRSLKLSVQGENLASDVFDELVSELDGLARSFAQTFDGMGAQAEGMVGRVKSAVGELPGFWLDTFQAMADGAATALAEATDSALQASDAMLGAAAPVAAAWQVMGSQVEAATSGLAAAVDGDVAKINGALAEMDGAMADVIGSADSMAADVETALSNGFGGAAAGADEALARIDAAVADVAAAADTQAGKIQASLAGGFDETVGPIGDALWKIDAAVAGTAAAADTQAGKISASLAAGFTDAVPGVDEALGRIDAAMADAAAAAKRTGATIGEALTGGAAGAAGAGGVVVAGGREKGKGGVAGVLAEEEAAVEKEAATLGEKIAAGLKSKLGGLMGGESSGGFFSGAGSKVFMGGLGAMMVPQIFDQLAQTIESTKGMQKLGGMTLPQTLELTQIMGGAGIAPTMQGRMIARMESAIAQSTGLLTNLHSNNPLSRPENLGLGRIASSPANLVLGGPTDTMARLFALAGLTPQKLAGQNALQQMSDIFIGLQKLPEIVGAGKAHTYQSEAIRTIFGGGRGGGSAVTAASLLESSFPQLMKAYDTGPGGQAGAALAQVFPKNAAVTAASLRMSAGALSMNMETLGIQLIPVLQAFIRGLTDFSKFLTDFEKGMSDILHGHISSSDWKAVLGDLADVAKNPIVQGIGAWKLLKGAATDKGVGGAIRKGVTGAAEAGTESEAAGWLTRVLPFIGPEGMVAAGAGATAGWQMNKMGQFEHWLGGLIGLGSRNPQTVPKGFAQTVLKLAPKYGIDPLAALAVSSAEGASGGIGDHGTSFGPWQMHHGGALPNSVYTGPDSAKAQSFAWSTKGIEYALQHMASGGAKGLTGEAAIKAIISGFEKPKDISKGVTNTNDFAVAMRAYPKMAQDARQLFDQQLLQLVKDADTHGKEFSNNTKKMLAESEKALQQGKDPFTKAGKDLLTGLLKGIQEEKPKLMGEARAIATDLELTLRAALRTHSPSEMTAAIGRDVAQGLLVGFRSGMPGVLAGVHAGVGTLGTAAAAPTGPAAASATTTVILQIDGKEFARATLPHLNRRNVDLIKLQGNNIGG